ncbi:hypothetical protein ACOYW6_12810 [Parablastomonas sp. CN1-191]|uniref:hypothetical protein n=1 Tax=Parablastomonas sp. CN1-191 TaxID=3400908 RepID=UPI003BF8A3AC
MSWFRRKPLEVPAPLWDFVADYDAKLVADWFDEEAKKAESSETFLMQAILALTLVCAADFQRNVGKIVRTGLPTANPDVIAFEGLAFTVFAVRQFHLPPGDYDEHDEPEMLVDAYREVIANLRCLIEKYTGWSIQKEWNARIMQHAQFRGIIEPMERLNGKLMSVAGVQVPPVLYGQPRLDALLSMELVMAMQAFTVTFPEATAKAIQNIISELNLLD